MRRMLVVAMAVVLTGAFFAVGARGAGNADRELDDLLWSDPATGGARDVEKTENDIQEMLRRPPSGTLGHIGGTLGTDNSFADISEKSTPLFCMLMKGIVSLTVRPEMGTESGRNLGSDACAIVARVALE